MKTRTLFLTKCIQGTPLCPRSLLQQSWVVVPETEIYEVVPTALCNELDSAFGKSTVGAAGCIWKEEPLSGDPQEHQQCWAWTGAPRMVPQDPPYGKSRVGESLGTRDGEFLCFSVYMTRDGEFLCFSLYMTLPCLPAIPCCCSHGLPLSLRGHPPCSHPSQSHAYWNSLFPCFHPQLCSPASLSPPGTSKKCWGQQNPELPEGTRDWVGHEVLD